VDINSIKSFVAVNAGQEVEWAAKNFSGYVVGYIEAQPHSGYHPGLVIFFPTRLAAGIRTFELAYVETVVGSKAVLSVEERRLPSGPLKFTMATPGELTSLVRTGGVLPGPLAPAARARGKNPFPHPCPRCSAPAFVMSLTVECTRGGCPCYVAGARGAA
jgi:hypothetical protein